MEKFVWQHLKEQTINMLSKYWTSNNLSNRIKRNGSQEKEIFSELIGPLGKGVQCDLPKSTKVFKFDGISYYFADLNLICVSHVEIHRNESIFKVYVGDVINMKAYGSFHGGDFAVLFIGVKDNVGGRGGKLVTFIGTALNSHYIYCLSTALTNYHVRRLHPQEYKQYYQDISQWHVQHQKQQQQQQIRKYSLRPHHPKQQQQQAQHQETKKPQKRKIGKNNNKTKKKQEVSNRTPNVTVESNENEKMKMLEEEIALLKQMLHQQSQPTNNTNNNMLLEECQRYQQQQNVFHEQEKLLHQQEMAALNHSFILNLLHQQSLSQQLSHCTKK